MAVVSFSRKTFEGEIGKIDAEMQHMISMFGTPVESVNEKEIQVEVFPNRPDLLSYHGFKRAFLAFIGKEAGLREYKVHQGKKGYKVLVEPSVKNVRPFTACAIIEGLNLDGERIKELVDIQEKLHLTLGRKRKKLAIGIYPLDKISLPVTFKAMNPDEIRFVPLDSEKEMSGFGILQVTQAGMEYSHLLSGKEKFPVFVDSENRVLSMPPIINSKTAGKIDAGTKDVFIECSGFDLNVLGRCISIISACLADMGGRICQVEVAYGNEKIKFPNLEPAEMKFSMDNINRLLGLSLNEKEMRKMLEKMGLGWKKSGSVLIPAWRTDMMHEVDIAEDIAIAFGYENILPEIPQISTIGDESQREKARRKVSEILAGLGMNEVSSYHLTTRDEQFRKMGSKAAGFAEVEGSKTEYGILRRDLAHLMIKILSENIDAEYPQKIFETGRVFGVDGKGNVLEKESLAIAVSPGNFTDARQIIEYLAESIGRKITFKEAEEFPEHFVEGRVADIIFQDRKIGIVGEMHPKILKNWKIKMPVSLFEMSLDGIFEEFGEK